MSDAACSLFPERVPAACFGIKSVGLLSLVCLGTGWDFPLLQFLAILGASSSGFIACSIDL